MKKFIDTYPICLVALLANLSLFGADQSLNRTIPKPFPDHPGNIFLEGEEVVVSLPAGQTWKVLDYTDAVLAEIKPADGKASLGRLPVGFYRLRKDQGDPAEWISVGVLAPLRTPTPLTSPIGLDVAMAWFYGAEKMPAAGNLCALAGVNWVRDRLAWGQMEPKKGQFASSNKYDTAAWVQRQAGLQTLQVNHSSPGWANPKGQRFPTDLRDAYNFHREMARRWTPQVSAFEPWNEADIPMFGGHTGSEMASLQKAAYLGLKAGNSKVIACLNVFAMHQKEQLADLHANQAWPYFDTFNLHHYAPLKDFPKLYADFRAVSAGKPLWVTECSMPVKWAGDEKGKEPTDADLRVQSERVAKIFVHSLHQGSAMTFYFMLPHYVEKQTQFGILRPDLTPRPAFLALAAVGRLMADARPLGQWTRPLGLWTNANSVVHAFLFQARPDGQDSELLVAWSESGGITLTLPTEPEAAFDHLGRKQQVSAEVKLSPAPQFFVFRAGVQSKFALTAPPKPAEVLAGQACPIVLQAQFPAEKTILAQSCYSVASGPTVIPIHIYNFSREAEEGFFTVEGPAGWRLRFPDQVELIAGEKREVGLQAEIPSGETSGVQTIRITGDFDRAGKAVLSFRLKVEPAK